MSKIVGLFVAMAILVGCQTKAFSQAPKDKFEGKWQITPPDDNNVLQYLTIKKVEKDYEISPTKAKGKKDKWVCHYDKKSDQIYFTYKMVDIYISYLKDKEHLLFKGRTDMSVNWEMELEPKKTGNHHNPK